MSMNKHKHKLLQRKILEEDSSNNESMKGRGIASANKDYDHIEEPVVT